MKIVQGITLTILMLAPFGRASADEVYLSQPSAHSVSGRLDPSIGSLMAIPTTLQVTQPGIQQPAAGVNLSQISQIGANNAALVSQNGSGNSSLITQKGYGNSAVVSQSGRSR